MDFLEENWLLIVLFVVGLEYATRGTLKPASTVTTPVVPTTGTTSTLPVLTPGSGVTLSPSGGGGNKVLANQKLLVSEYQPGYDSLSGVTDDPGWGDTL